MITATSKAEKLLERPSMRRSLVISLLFGLVISTTGQTQQPSSTRYPSERLLTARQIAERVSKSLVLVWTKDADGDRLAQGSGFFFRPNLIATNLHVLQRAWSASIEVLQTGRTYQASEIVAVDVRQDICVLRVEGVAIPALTLNMTARDGVGDEIYVAGNPEGLKGSFSKGIISAIRKDRRLIQIDASISPGSSGGPVVNNKAQVIGIAVGALTIGQHLNFAVPIKFLSSLPLNQHLPVNVVGELAVNYRQKQRLKGPVQTILTSESEFPSFGECVEGEARPNQKQTFDMDGLLTEVMSYSRGKVFWRDINEYDDRGFRIRETRISRDGTRKESTLSEGDWIQRISDSHRGNTDELTDGTVLKYDPNGNRIEMSYKDDRGQTSVIYDYDHDGRVIAEKVHLNGRLNFAYRYTYKLDDYDNWIKQVKVRLDSDVDNPCPEEVIYRQITYYASEF